jgi:hypothetical protein
VVQSVQPRPPPAAHQRPVVVDRCPPQIDGQHVPAGAQRPGDVELGRQAAALAVAERNELPASAFAFPAQRKEPLTSASHVRSALNRFDQVQDVTDADRALAFENIRRAASCFGVDMTEQSWHDLMH